MKINGEVFASAALLIVTALNAMIAFWGYNKAKDISKLHEKAKNQCSDITELREELYNLHVRSIERRLSELLRESPGIELKGTKSDKVKNEFEGALKSLTSLEKDISVDKRSKIGFLIEGFLCIIRIDYDNAIIKLNQYDQETPEKYWLLGAAYLRLKKPDLAEAALAKGRESIRNFGSNYILAKLMVTKALIFAYKKDYELALRLYKQALEYDPSYYLVHYNCACVYSILGRYDEAIDSLCKFAKYHDADVIEEIDSDTDHDFDNLLKHFGDNWRSELRHRVALCSEG